MNETIRIYHENRFSIIPLRVDGSKAPAIPSWGDYSDTRPTEELLELWFSKPAGVGVCCGVASCGLEVMDFDRGELFWPWYERTEAITARLPVIETPRSDTGYHVYYRCPEVCGNKKIAQSEYGDTWIETRGVGGYVVGIGSPEETHSCNYPYIQVMGPLFPDSLAVITPDERRRLWEVARSFSEHDKKAELVTHYKRKQANADYQPSDELTPWDDFNRRCEPAHLLKSSGWTEERRECWRRPGKTAGVSATLRPTTDGQSFVFTVFSTNGGLPEGKHSLFSVYAHLKHGGDFSTAAKSLRKEGFGA